MKNPKIIIDTDPGIDDALALLMILKSLKFDVRAITTVAGNSTIENVTRNAQAILNLIGNKTPVYSGESKPLSRELITAVVHGEDGLAGFDTSKTEFKLTQNAPPKIIEIVRKNPGEITLLTLGPLTNVARAFQIDPKLPGLIAKIVSMGGAINVPGNQNGVAEFNFFVDPEAASIVLRENVPKVLIPLDICNTTVLSLSDFETIQNTTIKSALMPTMNIFAKFLKDDEGATGILVYDALAAYFLLNPTAYRLQEMNIFIKTGGEDERGRCVVVEGEGAVLDASVVTSLNQEKFKEDFFKILSV